LALAALYQPVREDFNKGFGVELWISRIKPKIFWASASVLSSFCRIRCVRRKEESVLSLASFCDYSAFVLPTEIPFERLIIFFISRTLT